MPKLGIIILLELLMVGFGPYLLKRYLENMNTVSNQQMANLIDGTHSTIFAMNMAVGSTDKTEGIRFDL